MIFLEIWVSALSLDIDSWAALSGIQVMVRTWDNHVRTLAAVTSLQPQAAYAAVTKSLQSFFLESYSSLWTTFC